MFVNYKRKKSKKNNICAIDNIYSLCYNVTVIFLGCSQVGKAPDFDSGIRRFESCHPSQRGAVPEKTKGRRYFYVLSRGVRRAICFNFPCSRTVCLRKSKPGLHIYIWVFTYVTGKGCRGIPQHPFPGHARGVIPDA